MTHDLYDPTAIETHWKSRWAAEGRDGTPPAAAPGATARPKKYILCFFPYPSGAGLTVGHLKNYVSGDVMARYWRMRGYDVLHPMGWDAFGLPAENEARKTGRHPAATTRAYAATYRRQLQLVSASYDWSRELFTSDPEYYRWTQWFFLLLHQRGLAYRGTRPQWWCSACETVLANEQVMQTNSGRRCWRDHAGVEERDVTQWFVRIPQYADQLLADLDELEWPSGIVAQQRNWIGRQVAEGTGAVAYRLHDWSVSRQRFWGAPVPIVHCPRCGAVPVPEASLPVRLPEVAAVPPPTLDAAGRPRSPLAGLPEFVATVCPACGEPAERDTDTLDGFVCSSWYFLRFCSPQESRRPFDPEEVRRWMPVDLYIGGAEHAVMHLLYARFWTKVLYDAGLLSIREPFARLRNQGMVLDATGAKMSKSRPAHVVTPDEAVGAHGADAVRAYILFLAPFEQDAPWQGDGIAGVSRWLRRMWRLCRLAAEAPLDPGRGPSPTPAAHQPAAGRVQTNGQTEAERPAADAAARLRRTTHGAIAAVTDAVEELRFNSMVAHLMALTNALSRAAAAGLVGTPAWDEAVAALLRLAAPVVPHIAAELWHHRGQPGDVQDATWPTADATILATAVVDIVVQVDGVVRGHMQLPAGSDPAAHRAAALAHPAVRQALRGRAPTRMVVVAGRLVNLVTQTRSREESGT